MGFAKKGRKKGENRTANRGGVRCKIYIFCSVFVHDPFGFCSVFYDFFTLFFFFVGGAWYNDGVVARVCKTCQNLQKYLILAKNRQKK